VLLEGVLHTLLELADPHHCVNIQVEPLRSTGRSQTPTLLSRREVELRARRLVRAVEDLVDRETAKLLREDLDAPGAVVAELAQHGDVAGDRELAFAGQLAAVDHLVEPVLRVLVRAVRELDPGHEPRRDATEVVGLEPELPEVPRVEGETAIRRVRPLDDLERGVDVRHLDVVRHELVDDLRVRVPGSVLAELAEPLDDPFEVALGAGDVADLDVVGGQLGGSPEQERAPLVGGLPALVTWIEEPVPEEFELELVEPVLVEEPAHLAQVPRLQDVLEVGVPQPETSESDPRGLLTAVAKVEQAPLAPEVHLHRSGT
jgi:hypothetical protein